MTKEKIASILEERIEYWTGQALTASRMCDIRFAEKKWWEPRIEYAESLRRSFQGLKTELPHLTEAEANRRLDEVLVREV